MASTCSSSICRTSGTRVYTFIYTMANCMRAAARHGVPVVVCDRPNPIGGDAVEGAHLQEAVELIRRPVSDPDAPRPDDRRAGPALQRSLRHRRAPRRGRRSTAGAARCIFDETGLPWIIPSPNLPTLDSAVVYPGAVLFEGTKLSEGRGTTRPFELIGAPWIDGERLAAAMNASGLPGVHFRPVFFEPTFQKHARQSCGGCQIHVLDRGVFEPLRTAVELIDGVPSRGSGRASRGGSRPTSTSTTRSRSTSSTAPIRLRPRLDASGSVADADRAPGGNDEERFRL